MENKFLDLISSPLMNLDHTYRYSGTKLVEPESLSNHIVDTIMMGIKIIDELNAIIGDSGSSLDERTFLMKAVYHDLEEAITGDVPRPLKYHDSATLKSMRDVADEVAFDLFNQEFNHGQKHYVIWDKAKEGREGYILKLVDMLVVANKVVKEVSLLNNNYMLRVAHEVINYLGEQKEYLTKTDIFHNEYVREYLEELIVDAAKTINDILDEHAPLTSKINLYTQSMI